MPPDDCQRNVPANLESDDTNLRGMSPSGTAEMLVTKFDQLNDALSDHFKSVGYLLPSDKVIEVEAN